jgi:hypothetical protein
MKVLSSRLGLWAYLGFGLVLSSVNASAKERIQGSPAEPPLASPHVCDLQPQGDDCRESCILNPEQPVCGYTCQNVSKVSYCDDFCDQDRDRPCMEEYRDPIEPAAFDPSWRASVRGVTGGQASERGAWYIGAEGVFGRRLTQNWSALLTLHAATGVDSQPNAIFSFGATLSAEWMIFDLFSPNSALIVEPGAGIWLPDRCYVTNCPVALPMVTLGLGHRFFTNSAAARLDTFVARTVGIDGGIGYDPFLDMPLGRVGIHYSFDLAFR